MNKFDSGSKKYATKEDRLKIGLDASCIVPILCDASPFHERSFECYQKLRHDGVEIVIAGHALLESFSVMTRAPDPFKTPPREAHQLLHDTFGGATIAELGTEGAWGAIEHTIARGHSGGRVYDTVIAQATFAAGARVLLTWNLRHFHSIAPAGLEVREP